MNRCPSHARVVKGDLGACVMTHTPCGQGHFDCRESHVRILPIASMDSLLARIDVLGMRLDAASDINQSLKRRIALLKGSSGTRDTVMTAFAADTGVASPSEARANAEGILLQV